MLVQAGKAERISVAESRQPDQIEKMSLEAYSQAPSPPAASARELAAGKTAGRMPRQIREIRPRKNRQVLCSSF
jgi:hypothetical protein